MRPAIRGGAFALLLTASAMGQALHPGGFYTGFCAPNTVMAGAATGSAPQYPTCRALVSGDLSTAGFLQSSNNLSDVASASTARTNLGLGSAAIMNSNAFLQAANNLSDLASASTARTNLGLGSAAIMNSGAFLQTSNNLSDLANPATARTNIGISQTNIAALWTGSGCSTSTNALLMNGTCSAGGGSMVYPGSGIAASTGSAWASSYQVGTSANNLLQLNSSAQLPAVSAALLTNLPLNLTTTGSSGAAAYTPSTNTLNIPQYSGGASYANQLADINPVRTSATVATGTFGSNGTNIGTGSYNTIYTGSFTITLSSGGGPTGTTFYIYRDPSSATHLTVDTSNSSFTGVTLSGLTQGNAGATNYTENTTPLYRLTAGNTTADQWDAWSACAPNATTGCIDDRAVFHNDVVQPGAGLIGATSGGINTLHVDTTVMVQKFYGSGAPATVAGSTYGDLYYNTAASYAAYVCATSGGCATGTPTWEPVGSSSPGIAVIDTQVNLAAVSIPGGGVYTSYTLFSTTVPAGTLGTGPSCLHFEGTYLINTAPGSSVVPILTYGTSSGNITANSATGSTGLGEVLGQVCNNSGSTSAQQITTFFTWGGHGTATENTAAATTLTLLMGNNGNPTAFTVTPLTWEVWR